LNVDAAKTGLMARFFSARFLGQFLLGLLNQGKND